jgi:hypothetical protein
MKMIFLLTICVGDGDGLFRIAGVVADFELQLLAEDAALGVDVGDGHLGALADLVTRRGVLTGHRAGDGHQMIGPGVAAGEGQQTEAGRSGCVCSCVSSFATVVVKVMDK